MMSLTIPELREIILESGLSCKLEKVEGWLNDGLLKSTKDGDYHLIMEKDIDEFVYDLMWEGTIYEKGISDDEKIKRLLDQINQLKEEISELKTTNFELEQRLGIGAF